MNSEEQKNTVSSESQTATDKKRELSGLRLYLSLIVLFLVFLAGLELFVRLVVPRFGSAELKMVLRDYGNLARGKKKRFIAAPYVNYRLLPGFVEIQPDGLATRHNQAGFRDSSDWGPKSRRTLRIVCLGGSTTYGAGVKDNSQTYPAQLEELLNRPSYKPRGWEEVEVFNLGVGAYTSAEVLTTLHFYALPLEPDIVLIQSAINDVPARFYKSYSPSYEHFRKPVAFFDAGPVKRVVYRSKLVLAFGWLFGILEPITLQSRSQYPLPPTEEALANLEDNPPDPYRRNLEAAINLAKESDAKIWLLTQAYLEIPIEEQLGEQAARLEEGYQSGLKEHNEILRQLANKEGIGLIDLDRLTPLKRSYFTDQIHMSEEGNAVKAQIIAEAMAPGLSEVD